MGERAGAALGERASRRRARIVDAARALFVANGFHATGVAQIAKESGIAIGQLYRDFAAKEDIIAALVARDCATFMARPVLERAIAERDEAAVWTWIRDLVEADDDRDNDRLFTEIVAEAARNDRIAAIFVRTHDEVAACLFDALRLLVPDARFADRRALLADLILTQSLGIMQHRAMMPGLNIARLVDAVMYVIRGEVDRMREQSTHD